MADWIDLLDPDRAALEQALPADVHDDVIERLLAPFVHDDEPRPRIESHGHYVIGVLLVAIGVPDEDRIYYQEIDFILTRDELVTVS